MAGRIRILSNAKFKSRPLHLLHTERMRDSSFNRVALLMWRFSSISFDRFVGLAQPDINLSVMCPIQFAAVKSMWNTSHWVSVAHLTKQMNSTRTSKQTNEQAQSTEAKTEINRERAFRVPYIIWRLCDAFHRQPAFVSVHLWCWDIGITTHPKTGNMEHKAKNGVLKCAKMCMMIESNGSGQYRNRVASKKKL